METKSTQQITKEVVIQKKSIVSNVIDFFKAPPDAPPIEDREEIKKQYAHWRLRMFYSVFIGYVVFYLCKKNIAAALPAMSLDLGYTNTQLGFLGSSLYFTYAIGKFVNGVLADNSNVRKFLPTALIVSAIANICFAVSSLLITPGAFTFFGLPSATILLWLMVFFWGFNGWFQSMGFPAIAKTLAFWYSNNERGTKWALWSTSHQTGTFISILISGVLISKLGWQAAFYVPAIFSVLISVILMDRLRDKPKSICLPDIEEYREPENYALEKSQECEEEENLTYLEILKKHILFNKTIWLLAIAYIFVYIIRFGTEDWIIKFLVEVKQDSLPLAAAKLSFLPLCGIAGTIFAGYFSDKIFKGQRAPINLIFLSGIIFALLGLKFNANNPNFIDAGFLSITGIPLVNITKLNGGELLDFVYIGLIGMFTYGPQMLIGGLCAIESSSKKVASAATGFTGAFGYLGAIISGIGTGMVIDKFGWNGALYFWAISAFICIIICLFMFFHERKAVC